MKNNKFKLEVFNEDGTLHSTKEYKSYKDIASDLNLDYHIIRQLQMLTEGKIQRKFMHPQMSDLYAKIKIYNIKNTQIIKKDGRRELKLKQKQHDFKSGKH